MGGDDRRIAGEEMARLCRALAAMEDAERPYAELIESADAARTEADYRAALADHRAYEGWKPDLDF